jgi:Tfp pilus assembly protein PilW
MIALRLPRHGVARAPRAGFSLIELMISVGLSLVIVAALAAILLNISRTNTEMAKSNSQIESGRFAIQVLENDLVHAGFWGGFVPEFDDLNWPFVPADTPNQPPDPCLAYTANNWSFDYINALLGIAVQTYEAAPGTCVLPNKRPNTDVLVVRHAQTCLANDPVTNLPEPGCEPEVAGKLYFQSSLCATGTAGTARALILGEDPATQIKLAALGGSSTTSTMEGAYSGMTIRLTGGPGAGQTRKITTYNKGTQTATVDAAWTTAPTILTTYAIIESRLSTNDFSLKARGADCATAAAATKRKFVSSIYYIRDYATTAGDGIPTLVRSSFDPGSTVALAHQAAEALVEGVEDMSFELGIDNKVTRCGLNTATNYAVKVTKYDPLTCAATSDDTRKMLPINRGDGNPDDFVRCTTAVPCTAAQLSDVVAVKMFLLVRNSEASPGYKDGKTYCLASYKADGTCPAASLTAAQNDGYKRHLFSTTIRLTTISGRRETP